MPKHNNKGLPPFLSAEQVARLYQIRFSACAEQCNVLIWEVLCRSFFQRYVPENGVVIDLGAGACEFINHIRAARRIAIDINPETMRHAAAGVEVFRADMRTLEGLPRAFADVVFASNVLEHLPTKDDLMATLHTAYEVLRPGGKLLVMGPNIRFATREYWDFLDHHLPLSDRSLREALELAGFTLRELRPRFLPLSRLRRLPQHPFLVRLYLLCPPAHWILGKQFFAVAIR